MRLRERTVEDFERLVQMAARVRQEDGYPIFLPGGGYRRFLSRPVPLSAWVIEIGDEVVAHVALNSESSSSVMQLVRQRGIDGGLGVIARLLVDPGVRRQGFGARLLDRACSEAIERGPVPVIDVVTSACAAIALYRAAGWNEVGHTSFDLPNGRSIEEIVFLGPP